MVVVVVVLAAVAPFAPGATPPSLGVSLGVPAASGLQLLDQLRLVEDLEDSEGLSQVVAVVV